MKMNRKGFTLVEIMIVVAIIAILAAIGMLNYPKFRAESQKTACIANLRQIDGAVESAKMSGTASPGVDDIVGADKYIKVMPTCPTTSTAYTTVDPPACPTSVDGHVLPSAAAAAE